MANSLELRADFGYYVSMAENTPDQGKKTMQSEIDRRVAKEVTGIAEEAKALAARRYAEGMMDYAERCGVINWDVFNALKSELFETSKSRTLQKMGGALSEEFKAALMSYDWKNIEPTTERNAPCHMIGRRVQPKYLETRQKFGPGEVVDVQPSGYAGHDDPGGVLVIRLDRGDLVIVEPAERWVTA